MSSCKYKTGSVLFTTIAHFTQLTIPAGGVHCQWCGAQEWRAGLWAGRARWPGGGCCDRAGREGSCPLWTKHWCQASCSVLFTLDSHWICIPALRTLRCHLHFTEEEQETRPPEVGLTCLALCFMHAWCQSRYLAAQSWFNQLFDRNYLHQGEKSHLEQSSPALFT